MAATTTNALTRKEVAHLARRRGAGQGGAGDGGNGVEVVDHEGRVDDPRVVGAHLPLLLQPINQARKQT